MKTNFCIYIIVIYLIKRKFKKIFTNILFEQSMNFVHMVYCL